jgi:hypothetical protein
MSNVEFRRYGLRLPTACAKAIAVAQALSQCEGGRNEEYLRFRAKAQTHTGMSSRAVAASSKDCANAMGFAN